MKHGRGKYTKLNPDKPPIYGCWANGNLNGVATQGFKKTLYKDGVAVNITERDSTFSIANIPSFCGLFVFFLVFAITYLVFMKGSDPSLYTVPIFLYIC